MNASAQRRNDRLAGIRKVTNMPTPAQLKYQESLTARVVSRDRQATLRAKTIAAKFAPQKAEQVTVMSQKERERSYARQEREARREHIVEATARAKMPTLAARSTKAASVALAQRRAQRACLMRGKSSTSA